MQPRTSTDTGHQTWSSSPDADTSIPWVGIVERQLVCSQPLDLWRWKTLVIPPGARVCQHCLFSMSQDLRERKEKVGEGVGATAMAMGKEAQNGERN